VIFGIVNYGGHMLKKTSRRFAAVAAVALAALAGAAQALPTKYKYDALGRVLLASYPDGSQNGYAYDAAGNRTKVRRTRIAPPTTPDRLNVGQGLIPGAEIRSSSGRYVLVMQDDGNLVIYGQSGALWSSATYGNPVAHLVLQGDGNLVIYGPVAQVYWHANTPGASNPTLVMQNDGNLVLYASNGAVWSSGTGCGLC
jgi:YD repeat-containing protein